METQKNSPEVRFEGFTVEWEEKVLGDYGKVSMNKRIFKSQTSNEGEIPFYKIGTFGKQPDAFIKRELFEEYKKLYPYPNVGDILISASGSIGRTVVYKGEEEYFQDSNIVWLEHEGSLDNSFLKQYYSIIKWYGLEGSTIQRLYNKNILETNVFIPQLPEQKKIGNLFSNLDKLIKNHQTQLTKLKNLKKAMLTKMFPQNGASIPEIRFKDFDGKWIEKKLGDFTKITTGISNREDSGLDGKFTFFDRSEDIRKSEIFLFDCEAVIVAGEGSDFVPKYFKGKFDLHQRTYAIMGFQDSDAIFLFYYIYLFRKYFLDVAVGSTVKSLRLPMFQDMNIIMPKKEEQEKIGIYFKELDSLILNHKIQLDKLNNIKKACLNKLFIS